MKTRDSKSLNTNNIAKKLYVKLDEVNFKDENAIDVNGRHKAQEPMPKKYDAVYAANVLASSTAIKHYLSKQKIATSRPRLK